MQTFTANRLRRPCRRGLTLMEVVVSTLIVGLLLVAAMHSLGAALRAAGTLSRQGQATLLAEDLISEILQTAYQDPAEALNFGREASETGGTRAAFDDVDDFHGWTESPPQTGDGTPLPNRARWRRRVVVEQIDPNDLRTPLANSDDRGAKRITVTVEYDGQVQASLVGIQTSAWRDLIPEPGQHVAGGSPPANQPPTAVASASPLSGAAPLAVSFSAAGSGDPDGNALSYTWDFGDGTSGGGLTASHTYPAGTYTATLTVSDGRGGTAATTRTVNAY